jgi:hypothetical protein
MPITSLDQAIAGFRAARPIAKAQSGATVIGRPQSLWGLAGSPGAGAYDNTLNGVVLSGSGGNIAGQIPHTDPTGGQFAYLARLQISSSLPGSTWLCDRLWHNGGIAIASTSVQSIVSPTWPARDVAGSTNGDGVVLGLEVSAATGAGTPTITVSYTNQAGVAGRTGTNIIATTASASAGAFYPIGLQSGDTGVRSVQSIQLSATWTSGTINLVAYRVLATLESPIASVGTAIDPLTGGMPRLFDGVIPWIFFVPNAASAVALQGTIVETWG